MSSLAKTMALNCGVGLDKPYIFEHFYPLDWPHEKTIILHAGGGQRDDKGQPLFSAKIYDHFDEVVRLMSPEITKAGYKIYQIGGPNEIPVPGAINICGHTTIKQTAFLIRRCALFIGNDSMNAHMAGAFERPMVALYGPTDVKNHGPEWYDKDKTILLESHRFNAKRPSYASHEPEKTINVIRPETVAASALKLLGLDGEISRESYYFGLAHKNQILEVVPDNLLRPDFVPELGINLRMDYLYNEDGLVANLKQRKCAVFLNRPCPIEILTALRENVSFINVNVTDEITPKFAKQLIRLGVPHAFRTDEKDPQKLKEMRYAFYDVTMVESNQDITVENFWIGADRYLNSKLDRETNLAKMVYRTNKYIISKRGIFLSKAAYDKNLPVESLHSNFQEIGEMAKMPEFWKELTHFYIYKN